MNKFDHNRNESDVFSEISVGLRSYMLRIYNYMGLGLLLSAFMAFVVASSQEMTVWLVTSNLGIVIAFAPLAFILVLTFGVNKISAGTAQLLFWLFAAIIGISLAPIFYVYTSTSVARVFLITSITFLAMSIYGYTTKSDLTGIGTILFMALIGIVIASIVNIFMKSTMLDFVISIIGVIVFTGLTAWDTQKIKNNFSSSMDEETLKKTAVYGALSLYLNFLNLFLMLLRLFGERK